MRCLFAFFALSEKEMYSRPSASHFVLMKHFACRFGSSPSPFIGGYKFFFAHRAVSCTKKPSFYFARERLAVLAMSALAVHFKSRHQRLVGIPERERTIRILARRHEPSGFRDFVIETSPNGQSFIAAVVVAAEI